MKYRFYLLIPLLVAGIIFSSHAQPYLHFEENDQTDLYSAKWDGKLLGSFTPSDVQILADGTKLYPQSIVNCFPGHCVLTACFQGACSAISNIWPTPSVTSTQTATSTVTATQTATLTATATQTATVTPTIIMIPTSIPTNTVVPPTNTPKAPSAPKLL